MTDDKRFTLQQLREELSGVYDEREARAVVWWLLEVVFGLSPTDVLCGAVEQLSADDRQRLQAMMARLRQGEPVQYVAGVADFGPRQFRVAPGVLIPRPETYELCQWVSLEERGEWSVECGERREERDVSLVERGERREERDVSLVERGERREEREYLSVLDVGTGSGCIACTLALDLPCAQVTAWDISQEALTIAADNARRLGAAIAFQRKDILQESQAVCNATAAPHPTPALRRCWDIIVSNPPYVCESERQQMERRVLDHEPALALFVPDDDALRFYCAIGLFGQHTLRPGGSLYLELNAAHADETATLLAHQGYADIAVCRDQFGRQRFIKATLP